MTGWELVRFLHLAGMAFFVGGQLMLVAVVTPVVRQYGSDEAMRAAAKRFGIGSAIALVVFALVTLGHFRLRTETGAKMWMLVLATVTTIAVFVTFVFTTLVNEPKTMITMGVILLVSLALDLAWRLRTSKPTPPPVASDAAATATPEGQL